MILQELFENRLSDIHAAYQEYLRIGKSQERADDFKNSWGMSPDTWVRRHQDEINKLEAHQRPQPVGDEHLIRGTAVPPVAEGATVAYVVSYFDTKTGDRGESTVSALTQDDARDKIVDLMHERGYDVVVTGVRSAQDMAEADETSWTANSAQFRKEEDMSWTVEVTLEPRADINQGRGRQVKTMTVTGQSRDAVKKKLADYYRKNGWAVTGIKFAGDLAEMDKSQTPPNRHGDYPVGAKGTTVKTVKAKKVVKDLTKDLDQAFAKEKKGVKEGIMDVVKQTFNDNVVGWPMGTSDEQFIQGWARDIKDLTGVDVPTAKLVQLYNHYTKRSTELMQTHSTTNEQDVAESEDKVRQVNDAEYYHLKLLAKEAGVTLTGMGADKVTGDLHWQGDTRDGRRVSGTVKKVIDDNGEYIQGAAEKQLDEKQDACYHKVKSRYKVWPSAYASGALVQCRKKGAANWGNKSKK